MYLSYGHIVFLSSPAPFGVLLTDAKMVEHHLEQRRQQPAPAVILQPNHNIAPDNKFKVASRFAIVNHTS